ncbi:MAG: hypothetical protein ACE5JE_04725 [Thermoplasmata archaeon]
MANRIDSRTPRPWARERRERIPEDSLALDLEYNIQFPPFRILLDSDRVAKTIPRETTAPAILEALEAVT